MAYSSVRVQFEIGHEASVRTKKTPEGFTHDWEVFVRGADHTDIQCFVDKVVFHLHETFPKPRRVIKEPPYVVKESGYAGFVLPIDVYLKNKEEPKKINFQYDLQLQPSGPPISRVLREPRLFQNPSEDFRRKLIRGGGVGVDTPSDSFADDFKSSSGTSKGKSTESPNKKHKLDSVASNDSFAELFGTPIRRVLDPKKTPDTIKKLSDADFLKNKKKIAKYDSFKEEKEFSKEKERTLEKERNKDREKNKEKQSKRPQSPLSFALQVSKSKDEHKRHEERRKEEHEGKVRKKEEVDKKEKIKEIKDASKSFQEKEHKKERKDLDQGKKSHLTKSFEIKANYEKHNEFSEKEKHKHKHKKKEKEKNREREKQRKREMKKDKLEKEAKEREKDKSGKRKHDNGREKEEKTRRKSKSPSPVVEPQKKKPLNALLDELGSSDSMSPLSDDDSSPLPFKPLAKPAPKAIADTKSHLSPSVLTTKVLSTNYGAAYDVKQDKESDKFFKYGESNLGGNKKERLSSKKNKKLKDEGERRKAHNEDRRLRSPSSEKEEDAGEKTRIADKEKLDGEKQGKTTRERENKRRNRERSEEKQNKAKKSGTQDGSTNELSRGVDFSEGGGSCDDAKRSDRFTKEYVAQLKDLQHRIMSLEDNAELQKVVKVIAETGQYEITKKTFDFDLCALDSDTVKRLQDFFLPT